MTLGQRLRVLRKRIESSGVMLLDWEAIWEAIEKELEGERSAAKGKVRELQKRVAELEKEKYMMDEVLRNDLLKAFGGES
jgi:predicted  nucleic acid-binding Zn-ribbon protein